AVDEAAFQLLQQAGTPVERRQAAGRLQVLDAAGGVGYLDGGVERAGVAGTVGVVADRHEVGQHVVLAAEEGRGDGAEARVDHAADAFAVTGVHVVAGPAVTPLGGGHAVQQGHVLHHSGDPRQVLADADAGHGGRNRLDLAGGVFRLGVEGVDVTRPAL